MGSDPLDVYKEFLRSPDPLVDAVLKGHLLIEDMLGDVIERTPKLAKISDKRKQGFYNRFKLVKVSFPGKENHHIWQLIKNINRVRNTIAHELNAAGATDQLEKIAEILKVNDAEAYAEIPDPTDEVELMAHVFAYVFGALRAMKRERMSL